MDLAEGNRQAITKAGASVTPVIYMRVPEPKVVLPANAIRIDDYISEQERDEAFKQHLTAARAELAESLFSDEPVTIRTLRLRKGLSQAQLAIAAKTSQSHIARIELGRNDPGYDTFCKLAAALDADIGVVVKAFGAGRDSAQKADAA